MVGLKGYSGSALLLSAFRTAFFELAAFFHSLESLFTALGPLGGAFHEFAADEFEQRLFGAVAHAPLSGPSAVKSDSRRCERAARSKKAASPRNR